MNQDLRIEYFLRQLDQYLQSLPLGQRAEILTEIKSHIHEKLESEPGRPVDTVLANFGTPRDVAGRYLAAKGLALTEPRPARKVLKWLAIGTVALGALLFFAGLSVIWYFSPLIRVDRAQHHVSLFGGMIDVNDQLGRVKIGDLEVNNAMDREATKIDGEADLDDPSVKLVRIPFNNAKIDVQSAHGRKVKWSCKTMGNAALKGEVDAGVFHLNLDALQVAKCLISLPSGMASEFRGVNGKMEVKNPEDPMKISLVNGKVDITLDPSQTYDFDVKVKNGLQDFFPHSGSKGAVKVQVDVVNGLVRKE